MAASLRALEEEQRNEDRKNGALHVCGDARQFHYQQKTIQDIAYFKWLDAGSPQGDGKDFWLAAEKEIRGLIPQLTN